MLTKKNKNRSAFSIIIAALIFASAPSVAKAQSGYWISSSLQIVGGNVNDVALDQMFFLYNGASYFSESFQISASIPIVMGASTFTQFGNTYIPNRHNEIDMNEPDLVGHMMNSASPLEEIDAGFGDTYIYSSYKIFGQIDLIDVWLKGYVKIPTASADFEIGTGEFDYNLALGLNKRILDFEIGIALGYLFIGKAENIDLNNPITLDITGSYSFDHSNQLLLISYQSYSNIAPGVASPKQLGAGYSFKLMKDIFFLGSASVGLSDATSDYTFSSGLNFKI